jgi:hypothetical protein
MRIFDSIIDRYDNWETRRLNKSLYGDPNFVSPQEVLQQAKDKLFFQQLYKERYGTLSMYQQAVKNRYLQNPVINKTNQLVGKLFPKLAWQKKDILPAKDFVPLDYNEMTERFPRKMGFLKAVAPYTVGGLSLKYAKPEEDLSRFKPSSDYPVY